MRDDVAKKKIDEGRGSQKRGQEKKLELVEKKRSEGEGAAETQQGEHGSVDPAPRYERSSGPAATGERAIERESVALADEDEEEAKKPSQEEGGGQLEREEEEEEERKL